ncbi:MAG: response regulator [Paracoccaceae bacterium]
MQVLIVQPNMDLGSVWAKFLERQGIAVSQATSQQDAVQLIRFNRFDALVLDLVLPDGGAIAISDYATYRYPDIPIITVTSTSFFSDGSIFEIIPNAKYMMRTPIPPSDLAAVIEHVAPDGEARPGRKSA